MRAQVTPYSLSMREMHSTAGATYMLVFELSNMVHFAELLQLLTNILMI